jgi:hypothetical protein
VLLTLSLAFLYPALYYLIHHALIETTIEKASLERYIEAHKAFPVSLIFSFIGVLYATRWSWRIFLFLAVFIGALTATVLAPEYLLGGITLAIALVILFRISDRWTRPSAILTTLALAAFMFWLPFQLEASRRSFVARVKGDQRTIGIALETYYLDHESYPAADFEPREKAYWHSDSPLPSFPRYHPGGPATLTTPVAYLTAYSDFPDPIRYLKENRTYAYYSEGAAWILVSPGPNCIFDMTADDMKRAVQSVRTNTDTYALFASFTYDPSNGIYSRGDVWRIKQ